MPLSEYEEKVIAAMEQQLTPSRPDPFHEGPASFVTDATRLMRYGFLAAITGIVVVVLTFRSSELLAAVAFLAFFLGTVAVYEGARSGGMPGLRRRLQRRTSDE
jgi:Protein of unknown function (DUF3040)